GEAERLPAEVGHEVGRESGHGLTVPAKRRAARSMGREKALQGLRPLSSDTWKPRHRRRHAGRAVTVRAAVGEHGLAPFDAHAELSDSRGEDGLARADPGGNGDVPAEGGEVSGDGG